MGDRRKSRKLSGPIEFLCVKILKHLLVVLGDQVAVVCQMAVPAESSKVHSDLEMLDREPAAHGGSPGCGSSSAAHPCL